MGLALVGMVAAVVIQGRGHRREHETPTPFAGPIDFVSRFFAEQWVTFPRFVLSGGWSRNLARSSIELAPCAAVRRFQPPAPPASRSGPDRVAPPSTTSTWPVM